MARLVGIVAYKIDLVAYTSPLDAAKIHGIAPRMRPVRGPSSTSFESLYDKFKPSSVLPRGH
jgi:hypothetical protein